jgi:hypothetical protein
VGPTADTPTPLSSPLTLAHGCAVQPVSHSSSAIFSVHISDSGAFTASGAGV